jgi:Protein RETICULATA-related
MQRLPKHAFQVGAYSTMQRSTAFFYKAAQFGVVGFASSVAGHGLTTALVRTRKRKEAATDGARRISDHDDVVLAPVLPTSVAWGAFMFCSSNPRYQMLNGLEQRVLFPLTQGRPIVSAILVLGTRFSNSLVGGIQWIPFAKKLGVQ